MVVVEGDVSEFQYPFILIILPPTLFHVSRHPVPTLPPSLQISNSTSHSHGHHDSDSLLTSVIQHRRKKGKAAKRDVCSASSPSAMSCAISLVKPTLATTPTILDLCLPLRRKTIGLRSPRPSQRVANFLLHTMTPHISVTGFLNTPRPPPLSFLAMSYEANEALKEMKRRECKIFS